MIRHILLIQFKNTATSIETEEIKALFEAMPEKIEGVSSVEWGVNDSPENLNKNYTHTVLMTFANEEGRQNYLPHPDHESLKSILVPLLEDIVVFDYQV